MIVRHIGNTYQKYAFTYQLRWTPCKGPKLNTSRGTVLPAPHGKGIQQSLPGQGPPGFQYGPPGFQQGQGFQGPGQGNYTKALSVIILASMLVCPMLGCRHSLLRLSNNFFFLKWNAHFQTFLLVYTCQSGDIT